MNGKNYVYCLLFVMFHAVSSYAQLGIVWQKAYHGGLHSRGDYLAGMAVDCLGNVYVTGTVQNNTNDCCFLPEYCPWVYSQYITTLSYSANGEIRWTDRACDSLGAGQSTLGIAVDQLSNSYVVGTTEFSDWSDYPYKYWNCILVIKYSPIGETLWTHQFFSPDFPSETTHIVPNAMAIDDQGYLHVVATYGNSSSMHLVALIYSPGGTVGISDPYSYDPRQQVVENPMCAVDALGRLYVAFRTESTNDPDSSGSDIGTIKFSAGGSIDWVRVYNTDFTYSSDAARDIAADSSGNVYIAGRCANYPTNRSLLIKYLPDGAIDWAKTGGPYGGGNGFTALTTDDSGDIYVGGYYIPYQGAWEHYAFIKKYDLEGNVVWTTQDDGRPCTAVTPRKVVLDRFGCSYMILSDCQYSTVKYDRNGKLLWLMKEELCDFWGNQPSYLILDDSGYIYEGGTSFNCDGHKNDDYLVVKFAQQNTLLIKDGSALHLPIPNQPFKIYKVTNNPPLMPETLMGELTTDGFGKIMLPWGWFQPGDWVKVQKVIYTEPARKHASILPTMYRVRIDNGKIDVNTGAIYYDSIGAPAEQDIILDHTTITYDLLVSVEWDADQQYLESLKEGFKYTSNYLFDVTDGQLYLDSVMILDNKSFWDSADVQIYASNMQWPQSSIYLGVRPLGGGIIGSGNSRLFFPRIFYYNSSDGNRNLTYSVYPYDWTVAQTSYLGNDRAYPPSRTLAHEFGHYGIGFLDEYCDPSGNYVFNNYDFGMMDDQLGIGVAQNSEMSSALQYTDPSHRVTSQWIDRGDRSCWDYFQWNYQGTYNNLYAPIKKPSTQMLAGPNDDLLNLDYDVGSMLQPTIIDYNGNAFVLIVISKDGSGIPVGNSRVTLFKNNRTWVIEQGNTADNGKLKCLGVNTGDVIRAYSRKALPWLYGEFTVGGPSSSSVDNFFKVFINGDSAEVIMRTVQGNFRMINAGTFDSENSLRYKLQLNRLFSQNPSLEFYPSSGEIQEYNFGGIPNGYETIINNQLGLNGMFSLIAVDDSGCSFFVNNSYTVTLFADTLFTPQVYGPQGGCVLGLDSSNTSFQKILILSSDYPPTLNGLDSVVEQGGAVYSLCSYPNLDVLSGEMNYITIRYSDSDLKSAPEIGLRIHKWNDGLSKWEFVGGIVDTMTNVVTSVIESLGIYAGFVSCVAKPGDANSDSEVSVSDVVYLINYLFKGGPAPSSLCSGDANSDSEVSVSDVVYLINYLFKGGPVPLKSNECCL